MGNLFYSFQMLLQPDKRFYDAGIDDELKWRAIRGVLGPAGKALQIRKIGKGSLMLKAVNKANAEKGMSKGNIKINPNAKEVAKKFNTDPKNYERTIKKDLLRDTKELRDANGIKNPNLDVDKNGDIWMQDVNGNGKVFNTGLKVEWYR
jgi:hypothetical protein